MYASTTSPVASEGVSVFNIPSIFNSGAMGWSWEKFMVGFRAISATCGADVSVILMPCRRLFYCVKEVTFPEHDNFSFVLKKCFGAVEVYYRDGVG